MPATSEKQQRAAYAALDLKERMGGSSAAKAAKQTPAGQMAKMSKKSLKHFTKLSQTARPNGKKGARRKG